MIIFSDKIDKERAVRNIRRLGGIKDEIRKIKSVRIISRFCFADKRLQHGYGFGEVAGFVGIETEAQANGKRVFLKMNHRQNRRQKERRFVGFENGMRKRERGYGNRFCAAGFKLGKGYFGAGNEAFVGEGDDAEGVVVNKRDRAVFKLAEAVGFGAFVGDFLELQRAFEGGRIVLPAS